MPLASMGSADTNRTPSPIWSAFFLSSSALNGSAFLPSSPPMLCSMFNADALIIIRASMVPLPSAFSLISVSLEMQPAVSAAATTATASAYRFMRVSSSVPKREWTSVRQGRAVAKMGDGPAKAGPHVPPGRAAAFAKAPAAKDARHYVRFCKSLRNVDRGRVLATSFFSHQPRRAWSTPWRMWSSSATRCASVDTTSFTPASRAM